jgi:DNA repair exonuclease SbcCD ATPase subunit
MITYLKLTKFKRHDLLEINFEDGMTALGGANEAGKSSVLHAILYLIGGARLLPLSLDETVTWGSPASALRVEGRFKINGAEYSAYRAKSGAELAGPGFLSVGQSEVTSKFEELIGAPANLIAKLLIANQSSLGGVLEDGAGATKLIEELAGLDVIEVLIDKVQTQLPTGSTTTLLNVIDAARGVAMPDTAEVASAEQALEVATFQREAANQAAGLAQATVEAYDEAALNRAIQDFNATEQEATRLTRASNKPQPAPMVVTVQDIDVLQAAWDAQKQDKAVRTAWQHFSSAGPQVSDPGPMPEVDHSAVPSLELKAAQLRATRPETGDTCSHCGSRLCLSEEALTGAAHVDAQLADLAVQIAAARAEKTAGSQAQEAWQVANRAWLKHSTAIAKAGQYVVGGVWVGPTVSSEVDTTDYGRSIQEENTKRQRMAAHRALVEESARQRDEAMEALIQLQPLYEQRSAAATQASAKLQMLAADKLKLREAQAALNTQDAAMQLALRTLDAAKARYTSGVDLFKAAQEQIKKFQIAVAAQEANNALIKKLRVARPLVAAKLWASLLGSISRIFSDLRGEPSRVEKGPSGFTVNGKPAAAYSGSTLDILGLSIRVSLMRTFLPSLSMLILDEPSAAMDRSREEVMLGLLAQLGLNQVLVVSHSDAVKAVAGNVVEI